MEQMERSWSRPEAPWQRPLFPAQPKTSRDTRKRHDVVPDGGIAEIRNDVCRHEDIDRCANFVQAAKNVERVMLETRERPSRKQKVNGYTVWHSITARHCRMLAKGFSLREAQLHSDLIAPVRRPAARGALAHKNVRSCARASGIRRRRFTRESAARPAGSLSRHAAQP